MNTNIAKVITKIFFAASLFVSLLAAANMLAGYILFASYRQNPSQARFLSIEHAWIQAADKETKRKVAACAGFAVFLVFGVPFSLLMTRRKRPKDLHGKARLADSKDIQKESLYSPKGILLGKHEGRLLRLSGYEFVLVAAPTRQGKGVSFVIPNLLTFEGSTVVLDVKEENFNLTSAFRRQHLENEVWYFNPFSETTHRWNPLSYVSSNPNSRANDLLALAVLLYPDSEKDPFWPSSARNLFVGLGLMILESAGLPKTFGEILRQASGKGRDIAEYLRGVIEYQESTGNPFSRTCTDSLNRFLTNSETVLKGILATLVAPLSPWANAIVDKATSADDFDLRDVRRKKMSIYLCIPAGEIMQAGFIVNLFFSQLINENVKELPEQNPALKYQCLLMLDEFTAMGKVQIIAKGVGYIAGYNMRLALIIQDKSQLESVYSKEDARNIIANMGATVHFTPSTIGESEEYSKLIGNDTVDSTSEQRSNIGALNVGRYGLSETVNLAARAVMLPQEVRQMSKEKELVVRAGIPVILADKIRYYNDDFFLQRFKAVPMHEVRVGDEVRKVPLPIRKPLDNWTAYHSQVARSDFFLTATALPNSQFKELPTDLLLFGINDDSTNAEDRDEAIAELASRKYIEFAKQLDEVPALTTEEALRFESGSVDELLQNH
ncbi:type IV secretory system conjugative DNA transfer family protein [Delftia sp. GW456-R20]|uniref:type IV secretory system conjugative DNA transfer family protein n=1 Tax=Delftia sp. GW456-R20 TaxID=1827145 RepID=UPI0009EDF70E|nr:type IV secretory system conjugative DNA transfer family protein [Delftia sp. GW456-R20]